MSERMKRRENVPFDSMNCESLRAPFDSRASRASRMVEWRESNPRPKGLSPQESTCEVGLKVRGRHRSSTNVPAASPVNLAPSRRTHEGASLLNGVHSPPAG